MKRIVKRVTEEWVDSGDEEREPEPLDASDGDDDSDEPEEEDEPGEDSKPSRRRRR